MAGPKRKRAPVPYTLVQDPSGSYYLVRAGEKSQKVTNPKQVKEVLGAFDAIMSDVAQGEQGHLAAGSGVHIQIPEI